MLTRSQFETFLELPAPLLTAYVCTRSKAASLHGPEAAYLPWISDESRKIEAELSPEERALFVKQVERIDDFLRGRTPHEKSMVIFAGPDVWEAVPLQVEMQNELHWGKPAVSQLLWLMSEHHPYGVVAVDHAGARFFHYWLGEMVDHGEKKFDIDVSQWKSEDLGHVTGQGVRKSRGTQRVAFQKRLDSRYARLCRETAQQAAKLCATMHLTALFVAGPERLIKIIESNFRKGSRQPIILIDEDLARVSPHELLGHLEPEIANWERQREAELVTNSVDGAPGTVAGLDETLAQLQKGRIRTVVLDGGLDPILRECVACGWTDRTADPVCRMCGGERRTVTLRGVLPAMARKNRVNIEVVGDQAAEGLKGADGMAAWLRQPKAAVARSAR